MPLFDYVCRDCDNEFEALVQGERAVTCPECQGTELERKLPAFAVLAGSQTPLCEGNAACAACCEGRGPGHCPMN
jgi:putative FmdB family regulatory protein